MRFTKTARLAVGIATWVLTSTSLPAAQTNVAVAANFTEAAHDKNWGAFGSDPEWKKLSSTPGYTDAEIVTHISNVFLRPTAFSQI